MPLPALLSKALAATRRSKLAGGRAASRDDAQGDSSPLMTISKVHRP
jgi:hypothetical protein